MNYELAAEVARLAQRYGEPLQVAARLPGRQFSPVSETDRVGEVCMVVRRRDGRLLTAIKTFYPDGAHRLLTGGIHHGESIEAALLRETWEETGLDVAVRRFLAVISYRQDGTDDHGPADFLTFAFLLDETGGTLGPQDPHERLAGYREVALDELPAVAARLDALADDHNHEIGGRWSEWGRFRAVVHRVVWQAMAQASV
ncbi:MAG: NUDIX hydrolase [Roseiflexaceae bacterium]|nr:NUDIX hydrolase [Roseiflexaceae bacterium]